MRSRAVFLVLGLISFLMLSDFVLRGVALAFQPGKTDFSELYTGAWLWRHGQNFYDSALVTRTHEQLTHAGMQIAPVYPPTAFVVVSPLTYLPYGWANLVWLLFGMGCIAATLVLLLRLRGFTGWDLRTTALATLLISFAPLHEALHLGNIALLIVPLCLWAILLAEKRQDLSAGLLLGSAAAVKPQVAVWILFYYLLQGRKKLLVGAVVVGAALSAIFFLHSVPLKVVIASYRFNYRFWFAPGRPFGFTEGAYPFHVNIAQILLYRMSHSVLASTLIAHTLFVSGLAVWIVIVCRTRFRLPASLAISSLLALSFISLYHTVNDVTMLTLALCWAVPAEHQPWTRARILTCAVFVLLMLPGHSVLMRFSSHIDASITAQWWWNLFVTRYFVWLLLALNIVLLADLWDSASTIRVSDAEGSVAAARGEPIALPRPIPTAPETPARSSG